MASSGRCTMKDIDELSRSSSLMNLTFEDAKQENQHMDLTTAYHWVSD